MMVSGWPDHTTETVIVALVSTAPAAEAVDVRFAVPVLEAMDVDTTFHVPLHAVAVPTPLIVTFTPGANGLVLSPAAVLFHVTVSCVPDDVRVAMGTTNVEETFPLGVGYR